MSIYSNASIFLVLEKLPISMKLIVIKWKPISIVLLLLLMLSMPYFFAGSFDVSDREIMRLIIEARRHTLQSLHPIILIAANIRFIEKPILCHPMKEEMSGKSMGDYLERSRMFMLGFGYLLVAFSA
ncbi:hypothetical protein ES332_D13G027400v1 [Gossypium tomentosum]|uniref:Uncharacterized protein n=1 Tax=Gossypium tomentosum TaxID=34277 RepID=A0A5D2HSN5_GOSTO|nr:hypothetical protein ES332_D13G027400v1 [Gossypium tomentosum]